MLGGLAVAGADDDVEGAEAVDEVGQVCGIHGGAGVQAEVGAGEAAPGSLWLAAAFGGAGQSRIRE